MLTFNQSECGARACVTCARRTHDTKSLELAVYRTKRTPVLDLKFTATNVCLAAGPFNQ
jgi:hypothetical protein